ncbi:MAG TPA: hypothetical protein VD772_05365 [Anseongella sp.]|nr:hypothetical protein [Anseongella sp.]
MKRAVFYLILLAASASASVRAQTGPSAAEKAPETEMQKMLPDPIIDNCFVGAIEIGMRMDSIYRFFAKERIYKVYTYDQTGRRESIQVVDIDGNSPYMVFEPECYGKEKEMCTIWRITVRTPKYYTKRSIKVGNTLRELREAYVITSVKWEEGNLVALAEMSNISFLLDTSKISKSWYFTMSPALLPADAKIVGIRITE